MHISDICISRHNKLIITLPPHWSLCSDLATVNNWNRANDDANGYQLYGSSYLTNISTTQHTAAIAITTGTRTTSIATTTTTQYANRTLFPV